MQQELECLETDYETKIEKLKNEKMQIETLYKEEIQNLKVQIFVNIKSYFFINYRIFLIFKRY